MPILPPDSGTGGGGATGMPISPGDGLFYVAQGSSWITSQVVSGGNLYSWDTGILEINPGIGRVKINSLSLSTATKLFISSSNLDGTDFDEIFSVLRPGDFLLGRRFGATTNFFLAKVTGTSTDNTGWFTIPIQMVDTGGGFTNNEDIQFTFFATSQRIFDVSELNNDSEYISSVTTNSTLTGLGTTSSPLAVASHIEGGLKVVGFWDAATNTPDLSTLTPTQGDAYQVSVAGSTDINGETNWKVRDLVAWDDNLLGNWFKIDNTDDVLSVNGQTGAVILKLPDIRYHDRISANNQISSDSTSFADALQKNFVVPRDGTYELGVVFQWRHEKKDEHHMTQVRVNGVENSDLRSRQYLGGDEDNDTLVITNASTEVVLTAGTYDIDFQYASGKSGDDAYLYYRRLYLKELT